MLKKSCERDIREGQAHHNKKALSKFDGAFLMLKFF
jgi:hypothetical protein